MTAAAASSRFCSISRAASCTRGSEFSDPVRHAVQEGASLVGILERFSLELGSHHCQLRIVRIAGQKLSQDPVSLLWLAVLGVKGGIDACQIRAARESNRAAFRRERASALLPCSSRVKTSSCSAFGPPFPCRADRATA